MTNGTAVTVDSNAPLARRITLRTVMRVLLDKGPVSRAELARLTGLSRQTMSEVVRDLEHDGWIRETGRTQGSVGRSAVIYTVDESRAYVFGIDLGGTKIHAGLANLAGDIVCEAQENTDARGGRHVVDQLTRIKDRVLARAAVAPAQLRAAAIGVPGAFNPRTNILTMITNIPGLENTRFEDMLAAALGCPVVVENDVNMAAKGEQWRGRGREIENFVFIAIGTGIGMGIVNERRLVRGIRGAAGEIAYLPLGADPFDARVLRSGALESAIGSVAISARYAGLSGGESIPVVEIFERLRRGDEGAAAVLDEMARILAQVILASVAFADPETVILGGSVGSREELVERVRQQLRRCMPEPVTCAISTLGPKAALYGAIGTALERLRAMILEVPGVPAEITAPLQLAGEA